MRILAQVYTLVNSRACVCYVHTFVVARKFLFTPCVKGICDRDFINFIVEYISFDKK